MGVRARRLTMRYCERALSVEYLNSAPQSFALDRQQPKTKRENVMYDKQVAAPDNTAVRVALWRALHVEVDSPPHVFEDEVGLKLAAPDDGWRSRPDMSPFTRPFRASIVACARFITGCYATTCSAVVC